MPESLLTAAWPGLIEHFRSFLPVTNSTPVITLREGNTPLIPATKLGKELDLDLWFKWDGVNPTGSFKDRGMTLAITKALEAGSKAVICASTGNTSASMAAYAARASMEAYILVPDGYVAMGKLAQAMIHGAKVLPIQGNFDDALRLVRDISDASPLTLVNSVNPYRIEGQKTAAFEVCDQLGDAPDFLAIPVGNAGNITAYWKGFREYHEARKCASLPRLLGFQAAGAAPIVNNQRVEKPETIATAIRIGNPASWRLALNALEASNGAIAAVTDDEILSAYHRLASEEGLFCEPASAASVAGVIQRARAGFFSGGERVVCVLTGNGLKDPDTAFQVAGDRVMSPVSATLGEVRAALQV